MMEHTLVIAFDLGTHAAGCVMLHEGTVKYHETWNAKRGLSLYYRLEGLWEWELAMLNKTEHLVTCPVVAFERPYYGGLFRALQELYQVVGVLKIACLGHGAAAPIEIPPSSAKLALAGYGKAGKEQMVAAATMQFPGFDWNEHTAAALGVALACQALLKERATLEEEE